MFTERIPRLVGSGIRDGPEQSPGGTIDIEDARLGVIGLPSVVTTACGSDGPADRHECPIGGHAGPEGRGWRGRGRSQLRDPGLNSVGPEERKDYRMWQPPGPDRSP